MAKPERSDILSLSSSPRDYVKGTQWALGWTTIISGFATILHAGYESAQLEAVGQQWQANGFDIAMASVTGIALASTIACNFSGRVNRRAAIWRAKLFGNNAMATELEYHVAEGLSADLDSCGFGFSKATNKLN
jgi:hypothetical protein